MSIEPELSASDKLLQIPPRDYWGGASWEKRSTELSVLYATRFCSSLASPIFTKHKFWEFIYIFKGSGEFRVNSPVHINSFTGCGAFLNMRNQLINIISGQRGLLALLASFYVAAIKLIRVPRFRRFRRPSRDRMD
jgi:hypothetical protein